MQGDLISRKRVIETIWDVFNSYANDSQRFDEYETEAINNAFTVLQKCIENQPTAYSVEKVVEEMNKLLNEELHSVLKPLPDGTEYPEEAYRLLYLNTRLRGLIRNGGKE